MRRIAYLGWVILGMVFFATSTQQTPIADASGLTPRVFTMTHYDTSAPLSTLTPALPARRAAVVPHHRNGNSSASETNALERADEALDEQDYPRALPAPLGGWDGIDAHHSQCGCLPPDPNGDVGLNQYVQTVNTALQVWDKNENSLLGPIANNTLFTGFGGVCEASNDGDPTLLYDPLADRWFFSQFANINGGGPYYQCLAVSATGNPIDAWYRYEFEYPDNLFNDYAKFGVWSDAYYATVNQFKGPFFAWAGSGVLAFERGKMLNGQQARVVYFSLGVQDWGGMLPADFDGATPPPASEPNYFVEIQDQRWDPKHIPQDQLQVWAFAVNWSTPEKSTFTNIANLPTKAFDGKMCNFQRDCIPQKGTARGLDAMTGQTMYRLQYRNFGSYASLVTNLTVETKANTAGVRWYELRVQHGTPTIYQESTYAPRDGMFRWMASAAMDKQGNLALGMSESSPNRFPSIFYAGRLANDPLNKMAQGERRMKRGKGAQLSTFSRWGDYTMLAVDPADDCTFWYTNEYYSGTNYSDWKTWVGKFKFGGCN